MKRLSDGDGDDTPRFERNRLRCPFERLDSGQVVFDPTTHPGRRLDGHHTRAGGHEESSQLAGSRRQVEHAPTRADPECVHELRHGLGRIRRPAPLVGIRG